MFLAHSVLTGIEAAEEHVASAVKVVAIIFLK